MKLSNEQLRQFEDDGYIFLPEVFCKDEAELLKIDERTDGSVEVIDVKLNNRKTKKVGKNAISYFKKMFKKRK